MVSGDPPGGGSQGLGSVLEAFLRMPSPEKLLAEVQRLNNNMEILAPDLHKLAEALEGDKLKDIKDLTEVLSKLDLAELKSLLNEAVRIGGQFYERLWGTK
ncbi:hypothetical protein LCGC14_1722660 [marine sediment metagenome]|uniref:Uncharacterized protein n=1 Tax=marine sediment metagenome TaxID=412755 RepID=A0A0F9HZN7_9ZZZZ